MFGRLRAGLQEAWKLAAHGLSGRLLLLTVFFVMIGEVLIFVPSIGQYYLELLGNHIESAELAVMPFTLPESNKLPETLRTQILQRAGAEAVLLTLADQRFFFQVNTEQKTVDHTIDLTKSGLLSEMVEGMGCLLNT